MFFGNSQKFDLDQRTVQSKFCLLFGFFLFFASCPSTGIFLPGFGTQRISTLPLNIFHLFPSHSYIAATQTMYEHLATNLVSFASVSETSTWHPTNCSKTVLRCFSHIHMPASCTFSITICSASFAAGSCTELRRNLTTLH